MQCANAQDAIMEQLEGRLCPLQALALHRHINECDSCREFYLEYMEITADLTVMEEAPEGFVSAVMEKIYAEPAYVPVVASADIPEEVLQNTSSENGRRPINWLRIVGCLYALGMSIGFAVLYSPNWSGIEIQFAQMAESFTLGMANLSLWFAQAGQNFNTQEVINAISTLGNYVLAIAVLLTAALVYTLHRERDREGV